MIFPLPRNNNYVVCSVVPKPQPTPQPMDFWEFLQKASLVVGFLVTLRTLLR
jgi:hypothetical protein